MVYPGPLVAGRWYGPSSEWSLGFGYAGINRGIGIFRGAKKKAPRGNRPGFPGFFNPWNLWLEYIKTSMESMAGWLDGWMVWFTTGYPQRDSGSTGVLEVLWGWGVKKWTLSSRSVSINVAVPGQALSQDLVRWRSHHQYPSVIFNGKCSKENNSNIYIFMYIYIYNTDNKQHQTCHYQIHRIHQKITEFIKHLPGKRKRKRLRALHPPPSQDQHLASISS